MKISTEVLAKVRGSILFEVLPDEMFEELKHRLTLRNFAAGDTIVAEGSEGFELSLIVDGRIKITTRSKNSHEHLLALLHEGDFFGELELVDGRPRSSQVTSVDSSTLLILNKQDFDYLLNHSQAFAIRLLQVSSIRQRALSYYFIRSREQSNEQLSAEVEKLSRLIEATKTVNSTLELDKLLIVIVDTALALVNADRGTLYLLDEKRGELWSKVLKGADIEEIRLPLGHGIAGTVAATGDSINLADAYDDPRFSPEVDRRSGYHTTTMLCSPMRDRNGKIIGVMQLLNKKSGLFTQEDEGFIAALSVHASIAIENARLYEEEKDLARLQEQVRLAGTIQAGLLPSCAPSVSGYDISGITVPAQVVGGDLFDFISLPGGKIALCLGDVSGKGLPASLLMANVQATVRGQAIVDPEPGECMRRANTLLHRSTASDRFVTFFYGVLDPNRHSFTFCNAGHDDPIFLSSSGGTIRLKTGGLVLSILEDFPFEQESVSLQPGDIVVITSDGVREAVDSRQELFGDERLLEVVRANAASPAESLVNAIVQAVVAYAGNEIQADDITVVVLKRLRE